MGADHILVAVLIAIAAGWLVWVEFHCRCNRARQITGGTAEGVDGVTAYPEQVRKGDHERPVRGRRKGQDLAVRQER